jgi:hypothetical protein
MNVDVQMQGYILRQETMSSLPRTYELVQDAPADIRLV